MSKISDKLIDEEEVVDTYQEHWCHQRFHIDCSTCHSENRLLRAFKKVNEKQND
jgi:hypothetical protein